jgi:hypothetical protein
VTNRCEIILLKKRNVKLFHQGPYGEWHSCGGQWIDEIESARATILAPLCNQKMSAGLSRIEMV